MKLTFNINSWHYHLATFYGGMSSCNCIDLCTYIRRIILGFVITIIITLLLSAVLYLLIVNPMIYLWISFKVGSLLSIGNDSLMIAAIILYMMGILVLLIIVLSHIIRYSSRIGSRTIEAPLFNGVREVYRSIKEKYCPLINFK